MRPYWADTWVGRSTSFQDMGVPTDTMDGTGIFEFSPVQMSERSLGLRQLQSMCLLRITKSIVRDGYHVGRHGKYEIDNLSLKL